MTLTPRVSLPSRSWSRCEVTDPRCQVVEYADGFKPCRLPNHSCFRLLESCARKHFRCAQTPFGNVATSIQGPYLHHC